MGKNVNEGVTEADFKKIVKPKDILNWILKLGNTLLILEVFKLLQISTKIPTLENT